MKCLFVSERKSQCLSIPVAPHDFKPLLFVFEKLKLFPDCI